MHTTNYYDTFIEVAADCPAATAETPPQKGQDRTVANIQYDLLATNPYKYTSDDVLFQVYAIRNNVAQEDADAAREEFFAKGQPCLRSSPLTKRYGWGIHSDATGRIALYAVESADYARLVGDETLKRVKAMRSKRA